MMASTEEGVNDCSEVCGDGFNYGILACDDGNLIDNDGCSRYCEVESGFLCSGGSEIGPDSCADVQPPIPTIALVNSKNWIYITFDEEVFLNAEFASSVEIEVTGPLQPYIFDWALSTEYNNAAPTEKMVIEVTFYSSVKGGNEDKVEVKIMNNTVYIDATGNGLASSNMMEFLSAYEYIDPLV